MTQTGSWTQRDNESGAASHSRTQNEVVHGQAGWHTSDGSKQIGHILAPGFADHQYLLAAGLP
jgi:hypothetical protein